MEFSAERASLLTALQSVIGVVERRQTMPILANLLLSAEQGRLSIVATDLEVELVASADIKSGSDGRMTVPGRKLLDICRSLPEAATLTVSQDGEKIPVKAGRSRFVLATLPVSDFPVNDELAGQQTLTLAQADLRRLLDKTHFSMAQQDVRYYLNGMLQLFDRAIENYKKAFSLCRKGNGKEIINSWGIACRSMGDLKTAKDLFNYALFLDPWYAAAYSNLSTVFLAEGNYDRAIDNIRKAINLEPGVPEYSNNLGAAYRKKGQHAGGSERIHDSIWIKPDFMEAHNNLGKALNDLGNYDKAIEAFRRCIELKPDSAEVFINLGLVYRKAGRNQEAIEAFTQALEINPALALPHLRDCHPMKVIILTNPFIKTYFYIIC